MRLFTHCLLLISVFAYSNAFIGAYQPIPVEDINGDPGKPLFLTPIIKSGQIEQAQQLAAVNHTHFKGVDSYSGYLTVDEKTESHLFFWYFPAQTNADKAPVLLWLQGGPGATSMFGLFGEHGPFEPKSKHGLKLRKYSWNLNHNMIYIDNPVGTGYSLTKNGYAKNETKVGADLYEALLQFFQMFPKLQQNEFFVSGESYAGKYVPAISYTIHKNNPSAAQKINFAGMAIGNGLSDPEHQFKYGEYLYQLGIIDGAGRKLFQDAEAQAVSFIQKKEWLSAFQVFNRMLDADLNQTSIFTNMTGFTNYYNFLVANDTNPKMAYMGKFIQNVETRKAIHVGDSPFNGLGQDVEINLVEDIMQSVAPWVIELLSHYPVLIYNGQLDIIVAYPLTVNYLNNLKFSAADEYKTAKRYVWRVDGEVAGFAKHAGNLTEVLVRNAGHMVPTDQPKWAFDLITRFTHRKSFV